MLLGWFWVFGSGVGLHLDSSVAVLFYGYFCFACGVMVLVVLCFVWVRCVA